MNNLVSSAKYHHGMVIKAFREAANMTQPKLAELWPKEGGVSVRYVQDVESGVKHITDQGTLRKLGEILAIPLWQFGLSEYDPFNPLVLPGRGTSMYDEMLQMAKHINDPVTIALSLMSLGTELERTDKKHEAVNRLEEARDVSFGASKHIAAFVHAYLARAYASSGDSIHFQRAVDTSYALASSLNGAYGDGTDFVFGKVSSVLAERSWGYLELGEPQKTLDMKEEITGQIDRDQDMRLLAWIPLDWARANLMLGDIEQSVADARDFYTRVTAMKSPHAISRAYSFVQELEAAGFGDVQAVRDFKHELIEAQRETKERQEYPGRP
jgi:transcriptional regulator with XRE-family HTH domain